MAEVYDFNSWSAGNGPQEDRQGEHGTDRMSAQDIGLAFVLLYQRRMMGVDGDGMEDMDPSERALLRVAQICFPEMEEVVRMTCDTISDIPPKKSTRRRNVQISMEADAVLRELQDSASNAIVGIVLGDDAQVREDIEGVTDLYLMVRDLIPGLPKRTDAFTQEELKVLQAYDLSLEMDEGAAEMSEIIREVLDESDMEESQIIEALSTLQESGYNNEIEEADLWEEVQQTFKDLGLRPEGEEEIREMWELIPDKKEAPSPMQTQQFLGRVGDALRTAAPDILEYFVYRYQKEIRTADAEDEGEEEARQKGLRGKKAESYIARKVTRALDELNEEYDDEYLEFFDGLDAVEKIAFRFLTRTGDGLPESIREDVTEDSFAWNLGFFGIYLGSLLSRLENEEQDW